MKLKKSLTTALIAVAAVAGLSSCSGGAVEEANIVGNYISNDVIEYSNFLPTYNYFTLQTTTQQIEIYDDASYCFSSYSTLYSNVSFGADVAAGDETWNDQRFMMTRYYGSYTSEEDTDLNLLTISLDIPTRVVYARTGFLTIDSANWTDDMADSVVDYQGAVQTDADGNAYTADTILDYYISDLSVASAIVNLSTYKFTQIDW